MHRVRKIRRRTEIEVVVGGGLCPGTERLRTTGRRPEPLCRLVGIRWGKLVCAYPQTREGLLNAVHGGADVIVHTIPNAGVLDDSMLIPMKKAGASVIPTLKLWRHEMRDDRTAQREQLVASGVAQLRTWVASGGVVLFGTDVGYMDDYDTSEEFALMGEAGMSFRQMLASLTTAPAERFGESARLGRIAPGFTADKVVLDEDPSKDVRAFAGVRHTIRDGRLIYEAKTARSRFTKRTLTNSLPAS
jgi:imidazolonepropionase-like amidohydrolase